MTLQIGRLGYSQFTLRNPRSFDETADKFTLSGQFQYESDVTSLWGYEAATAAFRGYPCPDEPVVRVAWSERPGIAGWYEVLGMEVGRSASGDAARIGDLSVTLRRLRGRAAPSIDVTYIGLLVTNSLGITNGEQRYHWAVPVNAFDRNGPPGGTWTTRATETGTLAYFYDDTIAATQYLAWASDGTDYYNGACKIEQTTYAGGASGFTTLVGWDIERVPTNWRINNGLVRVKASTTTNETFKFQWWTGAAWSTEKAFTVYGDTFEDIEECTSVTVLRNSPEEVAVRTTWRSSASSSSGRITMDLRLRRGARTVTVVLSSDVSNQWRTEISTVPGGGMSTATTGGGNLGLRETALDADNVLSFIVTAEAHAVNAGDGWVRHTAGGTSWTFGIGAEVGAAAVAPNEWESEILGYFAYASETHKVNGR